MPLTDTELAAKRALAQTAREELREELLATGKPAPIVNEHVEMLLDLELERDRALTRAIRRKRRADIKATR